MTDNFALLGEPRLPWLDSEKLKSKFLALSSDAHPDRIHSASEEERLSATHRYAELNAAFNCLREPKDRLLHLLELELGSKPREVQRIPPGTMDLFVEVGQTCRDVDSFLAEKTKSTSPLVKVRLFEKGMEWIDQLNKLQQRINAKRDELLVELKAMNSQFESAPPISAPDRRGTLPLERLEQMYRLFSYISRWTQQIQERVVQLSF